MSVRRTAAADGGWPGPAEARRPPGRRTGLSLVPGSPAGPAPRPGRAAPEAGADPAPRPWAHVSSLSLGPLDTAPGCARGHARLVLREWDAARLADDAALAVSELVTNAIRVSRRRGTPVRLRLLHDPGQLIIEVWDQDPAPPLPAVSDRVPADRVPFDPPPFDPPPAHPAGPHPALPGDAECGRGLAVVSALAVRWGHHYADGGWKVVWCELSESGRAAETLTTARTEQK
jgi:anti-sigma regulatory factor (Ser/Thr protein kinase)